METIKKGTPIKFESQGRIYSGNVISARNWGDKVYVPETRQFRFTRDDWYIEINYPNASREMSYGYWKQGIDGGTLIEVDGMPYVDLIN